MPKKVKPTGRQKSLLLLHTVIYAIVTALCLTMYDKGANGKWVYPWPAWTVAAWGLFLIGHMCLVYTSYEDKGWDEYRRQLDA